jgi:hypothetical protein
MKIICLCLVFAITLQARRPTIQQSASIVAAAGSLAVNSKQLVKGAHIWHRHVNKPIAKAAKKVVGK